MAMRTYRYFTCPNGHDGSEITKENDQPYSTMWETVSLQGMKENAKDTRGYATYTCEKCREPMAVEVRWRNNKNQNLYKVLHQATDCTNSRDGTRVVVYIPVDKCGEVFVRDEAEFLVKFTQVS